MKPARSVVIAAVLAALASMLACAPPSPSRVVGLGTFTVTVYSNAPVTYYYDGTAGEHLNVATVTVDDPPTVSVLAPDRSPVVPTTPGTYVLPVSGRFAIVLSRPNTSVIPTVVQVALTLSHDVDEGPVPLGTDLPKPVPGQTLHYTLAGAAGDVFDVGGVELDSPGGVRLIAPGQLTRGVVLPESGVYPVQDTVGGAISHPIDGGPISLGPTVIPTLADGQTATYDYHGTAGETVGIHDPGSPSAVEVDDPAGTPLHSISFGDDVYALPVTGDYHVIFVGSASSGVTALMTDGVDGGTLAVGTTTPPALLASQPLSYEYPGTAGEVLTISTEYHLPGPVPGATVIAPDGTTLLPALGHAPPYPETFTLPLDGSYRVLFAEPTPDPSFGIVVSSSLHP